ncbi:DUF1573 domain-containing protein [Chitinophaga sp. GCM10012297]|uniref:DUF1573 domain-containing protein n=1 Tax=Chitinophaga chungangae TaxID=2821488 RepID=A0ABS3Y9R8_9BACT|nr:DUF1573 domain-containing protein [Chitinophaga chungangae]MBO9151422.1 DUF1573 domain-containing protein [Chitinophaga chungangae]
MRPILYLFLAAAMAVTACGGPSGNNVSRPTDAADTSKGTWPVMTFEKESHNFGNVTEGEVVEYSFKFTNTGNRDLLITKAEASCGCTVPEWPKEPLKPGESGFMKVKFDSKGRPEGYTEKELYIQANTNPAMINGPKIQCVIVAKK